MIRNIKFLGIALILVGVFVPAFHFTKAKVDENKYIEVLEEKEEKQDYFAILEINEIHLKRELFPAYSKENHVDKNVLVHKMSTFPGSKESNIIFAAHSGNGKNAFFKDLYLLEESDLITLYYQGVKWLYEIVDIEEQEKTGVLYLKEDYPQMITLITCTKGNSNTQTIYYGVLKESKSL